MRPYGVINRNRDNTINQKWQGKKKKVCYPKKALENHVTKYFVYILHAHIIRFFFFLKYINTTTFPF